MKLFLHSFVLFICLFNCRIADAQVPSPDSVRLSDQVLRIEQTMLDAVATGDSALWNKWLATDFYIVTEDGTGNNKKDFLAGFRPMPAGYSGSINLTHPHFIFFGETTVLQYIADEHESVHGQAIHTSYSVMNTWHKTSESWKLEASQVFEIPQLPPAISVPDSILRAYAGTYFLTDTITCTITMERSQLFMSKQGRKKEELIPETTTQFFRHGDARSRKLFVEDEHGKMMMKERRNGQDLVWKRKEI